MENSQQEKQPSLSGSQLLEAVLKTAVGAIITIDERGIIQTVNPATERLFGYTAAELIGNNVKILMPEPHRMRHDGYLQHHLATGETNIIGIGREVDALRKSGETFPVHLAVSAFHVDGKRYFAGMLHDLTERDHIKGQLDRQGSIFEAVFDNVPEVLIVTDSSQTITLCNTAVMDVFGWTPGELVGRNLAELHDTAEEFTQIDQERLKLGIGERLGPIRATFRRRDGVAFAGESLSALIVDGHRRSIGYLTLVRDVRQQIEQQNALRSAQRMEAFGQLTGGVAHDFNNLLTVITGNHELLEMRLQEERNRTLLKRAQDAAEMGARLTDRLLTFARRRQFEAVRLNLNEQVIGMADLLRRTIGEHLHFSTDLQTPLWDVQADPSEIENAVLNLAINARDAMPAHGRLTIATANVDIDPEDATGPANTAPGRYVCLSVSDTGAGMPPEVLERVFEPFYTTKAPGKGTGLGLSTIYGFVRQVGGTVTIESTLGRGTTVSVYLPRAEGDALPAHQEAEDQSPPFGLDEMVLLVEDNDEVALVTRQRLEQLGYHIVRASSGQEAVDMLEAGHEPDLVLSDVVMPGALSGFDVVSWTRANRPATRVLLMSGFAADAIEAQGNEAQGVSILRKPFSLSQLANAVRRALDDEPD